MEEGQYRVFGSVGSPYSVKVRSYFRYKGLKHVWLVRNTPELAQEHAKASKLPLVPTVISPDGTAMQDSTPIVSSVFSQPSGFAYLPIDCRSKKWRSCALCPPYTPLPLP